MQLSNMKTDFPSLLRERSLKSTPVRLALLRRLARAESPQSAKELARELSADTVTVYRTLGTLEKARLIERVDIGHAHPHYELALSHHHHIICERCGTLEHIGICVPPAFLASLLKRSRKFSTIDRHRFECYSLCRKCR
jgi:Fe2+ or Zn2+ uptake regulation protein